MRRFRNPSGYNFWPSFVDALSTLLIVVLFFCCCLFWLIFHGQKSGYQKHGNQPVKFAAAKFGFRAVGGTQNQPGFNAGNAKTVGGTGRHQRRTNQSFGANRPFGTGRQSVDFTQTGTGKETAAKSKELKTERKISQEAKAHLALLNAQTEKMTKELSRLGNLLDQADKKDKEQKRRSRIWGKTEPRFGGQSVRTGVLPFGIFRDIA